MKNNIVMVANGEHFKSMNPLTFSSLGLIALLIVLPRQTQRTMSKIVVSFRFKTSYSKIPDETPCDDEDDGSCCCFGGFDVEEEAF